MNDIILELYLSILLYSISFRKQRMKIQLVFDLHSDHFYGNLQARIVENMDYPSEES